VLAFSHKGSDEGESEAVRRRLGGSGLWLNRADGSGETGLTPFGICLSRQRGGSDFLAEFALVRVRGEVDLASSPEMHRVLSEVLGSGTVDIVLDLEAVEFIDASGIDVLAEVAIKARAVCGSLVLRRPSHRVLRVLDLLQLYDILPLEIPSEIPN
jgi:anti-sigma B factor antagonist